MNQSTSYPPITALLVTVGGAPASAIHTLNELKPRFICFFVSAQTQSMIRENILPALSYSPEHYDWIRTPSPQNLLDCYQVLRDQLPGIMDKWGIQPNDLGVEYTGGTKPMSVAAALATIDSSSRYFYVGASDPTGRDRDGIGVVLDGRELTWYQANPWEALAVNLRREIALLFNHGRYKDASERAERLAHLVPQEMQPVYRALALLIDGYALWDRFAAIEAQQKIGQALKVLQPYAAGSEDPIRFALVDAEKHLRYLAGLTDKKNPDTSRLDLLDMLANAERRGVVAGRYDDAVARLYSALEGLSRARLLSHGIKASAVQPGQIPEHLREDYLRRFSDPDDPAGVIKIGLEGGYLLLAELGDPLGLKYKKREAELKRVLFARNQSRLAHGTQPVEPGTYAKMREILFDFADVQADELPVFPTLRL